MIAGQILTITKSPIESTMPHSSPYTLTANTPINILDGITGRRHNTIMLRFISTDEDARLLIRRNATVTADAHDIILIPDDAFEIYPDELVNVNPVISVMSTVTGAIICF